MSTVRQILHNKSADVCSISPQASVFEALKLMAEKDIGALLVLDNDKLMGIFSERDYARKVVLQGRSSKTTTVGVLMTPTMICVTGEQTVEECMALMTKNRVRHLPVVENEKLVGIVSIGDVVKSLITAQESTIRQLEGYVTGNGFA